MEKKNIAINAGIGYILGNYLLKGLTFLTIPIFSRLLSTSDYGIYNTFVSYEAVIYILLGFAIHTSYKNSKYKFKTVDEGAFVGEDYDSYVSSTMILLLVSTLIWVIAVVLFSKKLSKLLGMNVASIYLLIIYSFSGAVMACFNAYIGLKYQYKSFIKISGINAIGNVLLSVFLITTVCSNNRYMGRVIGTVIPVFSLSIYIIYKFIKQAKPQNYKLFWSWGMRFSLPLVPHGISQVVLSQFDRIMINKMINASAAGIYSFAYNIYAIINVTARSLDTVWNPWFYNQLKHGNKKKIKEKSNIYMILMMLISIGVILASPELVKILGKRNYWEASYSVMPIIAGGYFSFLYTIPASIEYYHEKTKFIAIGTVSVAIVNIGLNIVFIDMFGYIAAAYTTLFTYILYFAFHYIIAWKIQGECLFSNSIIITCSSLILIVTLFARLFIEDWILRWIAVVIVGLIFIIYEEKTISLSTKILIRLRK